jgi:hypothetical protein
MKPSKTNNTNTANTEVEIIDDPFDMHIDGLDEEAQEHREPVYAAIQWINGEKKAAPGIQKEGGFFINSREQKKAALLPGWEKVEITFENGDTDEGPGALRARIAVIRSRKCWTRKGADGKSTYFPWNRYEKGMSSKQQYLVAIEGCPEIFSLSVKGTTGIAIEAALSEHQKKVVSAARMLAKQTLPPYAFWLELRGGEYTQVGSGGDTSWTTPPRIVLPAQLDRNALAKLFVGKDSLLSYQQAFKDADAWAARWADAKGLKDVADEESGAKSQWRCLPHLGDRYLDLVAKLHAAKAPVSSLLDGVIEENNGMQPSEWDDDQMQGAIATLNYALKRATNTAAVAAVAGISRGIPASQPEAVSVDSEDIPF